MDKYIFPELFGDEQTEEPVAKCRFCECDLYVGDTVFREYGDKDRFICGDCLEDWAQRELECVDLEEEA